MRNFAPIYFLKKLSALVACHDHFYLYAHDKHGNQKYKCLSRNRQFTLVQKQTASQSKYPKCQICGKAIFIWHLYDTYLHFKCGSKTCKHVRETY